MGGGLGSTMAQGMAFGVGSAVAHQAIGRMMGGGSGGGEGGEGQSDGVPQENGQGAMSQGEYGGAMGQSEYGSEAQAQAQPIENPCMSFNNALLQCLQANNSDIKICQMSMDSVVQCERDNANMI